MTLGYDNYGTSFQSLYSPMGIVQSNYSYLNPGAGMNGAAGAYGAGYPGMNTNISNNFYSGFYDPLANQMTQEALLKHDKDNNDYYARPIAPHIKEDNTGTILGAIATGVSALALLAALRKGKLPKTAPRVNPASSHVNPGGGTRNATNFNTQGTTGTRTATNPTTGQNPATGANPSSGINPAGSAPTGAGQNPTSGVAQGASTNFQTGTTTGAAPQAPASAPSAAPSLALPPHTQSARWQYALNKQAAAMNLPSSGLVYTTPYSQPALPQYSQRMQAALDKQAAAMNLPSSGQVYTTPYSQPALPQYSQRMQAALDKQAAAMNLPSSGQVYTTPYSQPALPQYRPRMQAALDNQAAAMNLPSSGQVYTTPYNGVTLPSIDKVITGNNPSSFVKEGSIPERYLHPYIDNRPVYRKALPQPEQPVAALPQYTSKMQAALDKQAAASELPSSGKVYEMP